MRLMVTNSLNSATQVHTRSPEVYEPHFPELFVRKAASVADPPASLIRFRADLGEVTLALAAPCRHLIEHR